MKVALAAIGKFHHFHLARCLYAENVLKSIICGYPWVYLKDEHLPREVVKTFPWVQSPLMASRRFRLIPSSGIFTRGLEWVAIRSFGAFVKKWSDENSGETDVLVALSGSGLEAGRVFKNQGKVFVCDRGSTHIRFQDEILKDEYKIWNLAYYGIDERIIEREEKEYELSDWITVPSEFNVKSFTSMGVDAKKIRKISYGANMGRFFPAERPDDKKFIVLYVGQISLRKGVPYLLEAFGRFKHPNKELWMVGMMVDGMKDITRRLSNDKIKWLGRIPNAKLPELYRQSHVFVLPSIEEGLAMVQGEALASGCPVIATENTGSLDLFENGKEGFIVPIRSSNAILERLQTLAESPALMAEMANAAVERVKSIGGWAKYGENYSGFLRKVVSDPAYRN